MNAAELHLMLNHLPVLGAFLGMCLLVAALATRSDDLKWASVAIFVLSAVLTFPVYFTGTPALQVVGHMPGVSPEVVDRHREVSQLALAVMIALGATAGCGWFSFRRVQGMPRWFANLLVLLSLIAFILMVWAAHLGGKVRHPEISQRAPSGAVGTCG